MTYFWIPVCYNVKNELIASKLYFLSTSWLSMFPRLTAIILMTRLTNKTIIMKPKVVMATTGKKLFNIQWECI